MFENDMICNSSFDIHIIVWTSLDMFENCNNSYHNIVLRGCVRKLAQKFKLISRTVIFRFGERRFLSRHLLYSFTFNQVPIFCNDRTRIVNFFCRMIPNKSPSNEQRSKDNLKRGSNLSKLPPTCVLGQRIACCTSWVKRWSAAMDIFQTFFKTDIFS